MKSLLRLLPRRVKRAIHEEYTRAKGCSYNHDGLVTFHHSDFLKDPLFQEAYRLGKATGSWGSVDIEWRVYVACWAANKGKALEGDFVECGVNKGGLSRAVMHYIDFRNQGTRRFYLLDTFCGFPEEFINLAAQSQIHSYRECYQEVRETFKEFANVRIVRGKVPEVLPRVSAERICYLSLDMNCAEPEIAAAEYFWPRLASGAVMVLDDYGYSDDYLRQKRAFDEFARNKGVQVLLLPTGQGLVFKP
jgi:O-methyltransferase